VIGSWWQLLRKATCPIGLQERKLNSTGSFIFDSISPRNYSTEMLLSLTTKLPTSSRQINGTRAGNLYTTNKTGLHTHTLPLSLWLKGEKVNDGYRSKG